MKMDERLKEIVDILTRQALENQQMADQDQRTEVEIEEDRVRMENWEKYEQLVASEDALSLLPPNLPMTKENIQNSFIMQEFYPKLVDRGDSKLAIDQALQTLYEACDLVGKQEVPLLRRYFHVIEDFIWKQVDRTEIQTFLLNKLQQRKGNTSSTLSDSEKEVEDKKLDGLRTKINHSYNNYITEYQNISRALRLPPVSEDRLNKEIEKLNKYRSQSFTNLRTYFTENQDLTEVADYSKSLLTEMELQRNELKYITGLIQTFSKKSLQEREMDRKGILDLFKEETDYQKGLYSIPEQVLNPSLDEKRDAFTASNLPAEPSQPKEGEVDMSDPVALRQEILRLLDLNAPWKEISPYYLQLETAAYRKVRPQEEVDQVTARREKLEQEIKELKNNYNAPITLNAQEDVNMTLIQQMYQNRLKTVEYYETLSDEDFYSMTKEEAIAREKRYIEDLKVQYDTLLVDVENEYNAATPVMRERQKQLIAEKQAELDALPLVTDVQKIEEIARLREEFQQGVEQKSKQNPPIQSIDQSAPTVEADQLKTESAAPEATLTSPVEPTNSQEETIVLKESDDRTEVTSIDPNHSILVTDTTVREGLKAATESALEAETAIDMETTIFTQEEKVETDALDPRNMVIGANDPESEDRNRLYMSQLAAEGKIATNFTKSFEKDYNEKFSEMFQIQFDLEKEAETKSPCTVSFIETKVGDQRKFISETGTKLGDVLDQNHLEMSQVTIGVTTLLNGVPNSGWLNGEDIQNVHQQIKSNSAKIEVQAQGKSR